MKELEGWKIERKEGGDGMDGGKSKEEEGEKRGEIYLLQEECWEVHDGSWQEDLVLMEVI